MSLQKYVQQLKPIQENYIKPDSRVQNLVESNTEYATLMEKAIVMAYNMKKKRRSEDQAANLGQIKMEDWQKEKKTLDSLRSDWEEESKNIVKKLKVGDHMIQLGRKGDANYYNKELNYPASDTTSKTDIMGSNGDTFSVKEGGGAFLASGAGAESSGMVMAALLNYEKNEGKKASEKLYEFVEYLNGGFNELRYSDVIMQAEKGKIDFQTWYVTTSGRRAELAKFEKTKKKQDDYMKAELSIFKIPKSDSRAQKKLDAIPKAKPITKSDLDKIYFPAYVTDSYKIGTGKSPKAGRTVYGQVNPKYFAAKDKEVIKDNTALKEQIVTILKTTVAQKEAHNEWKGIFGDDEVFRKYLVYEASSGCFKFTGKLNDKKNYDGDNKYVAKQMFTFSGGKATIYDDIFKWSANNTDKVKEVSFDIKGGGKGRYTAVKFDYNPEEQNIYSALDRIMEEEWYHLEQLNEGLISFLKRKWRNAKDAIAGFIVAAKEAYKKYIESVIIRVIDAVKKAADKGIKFFLEFMDLEINASVSFGKM